MLDRFLLYVDLLGFSDLVMTKPEVVPRIFETLDSSPAHTHPDFTALQFSDTLLVFNEPAAISGNDKHYCAMFLCEFAQDLQHKLLGSNAFIRAIVTYGPLDDSESTSNRQLKNIRAVWGEALIKAYRSERNIQAIGTFVDTTVEPYMQVFEIHPYDLQERKERIWFVDTATYLRSFFSQDNNEDFSFAEQEVVLTANEGFLIKDLYYLKLLFENSHDTTYLPKIRAKYLTTWEIYRLKYRGLCKRLQEVNFDFSKIIDIDWKPWIDQIISPR